VNPLALIDEAYADGGFAVNAFYKNNLIISVDFTQKNKKSEPPLA
jgi:hypothetical protein